LVWSVLHHEEGQAVMEIDLLRERNRLAVVSLLAGNITGSLPFTDIQEKTGLTSGNLSSHLRMLETHGLVRIEKSFSGRKPCTTVFLKERGREALEDFVTEMERFIATYRS
jgi:DNA-binding MarR family transcriptional regulator